MKKMFFVFLLPLIMIFMGACKKATTLIGKNDPVTSSIIPQSIPFWFSLPNLASSGRTRAFGFSIGNKGYVGGGNSGASPFASAKDFWEYDPSTNVWTQKANLAGFSTENTASFSIGNKGYICTGYHSYVGPPDTSQSNRILKDTWEYDQATNKWTKKADFPGLPRYGSVGMGINGKGYVGTGEGTYNFLGNTLYMDLYDWYEFDPVANTWNQKANLPGSARQNASGAASGSYGYLGCGIYNGTTYLNDWYQYNPASNTWVQKASMPGFYRSSAVTLATQGGLYICGGENSKIAWPGNWLKDVWQYNPVSNQWTQWYSMPRGRRGGTGFSISNIIYVGTGDAVTYLNMQASPWDWGFNGLAVPL